MIEMYHSVTVLIPYVIVYVKYRYM